MLIGENLLNRMKGCSFEDLCTGDMFVYNDTVWMKVVMDKDPIFDMALALHSGRIYEIGGREYVNPVECVVDEVKKG